MRSAFLWFRVRQSNRLRSGAVPPAPLCFLAPRERSAAPHLSAYLQVARLSANKRTMCSRRSSNQVADLPLYPSIQTTMPVQHPLHDATYPHTSFISVQFLASAVSITIWPRYKGLSHRRAPSVLNPQVPPTRILHFWRNVHRTRFQQSSG